MLVCVCVSAQEIPPKIPNETQAEEQRPAHGLLKQQWINLFPHTVNHAHLRWGLGRGRPAGAGFPADSAILLGPPAVRERDEGASRGDEEPSNQTTQVVHLGGRLLEAFWETKKGIYSPPLIPEANNESL